MKSIVFAFSLFVFIGTSAQRDISKVTGYAFHETEGAKYTPPNRTELIKTQKLATKTTQRIYGKQVSTETVTYDQEGRMIAKEYKSGKIAYKEIHTYDEKGHNIGVTRYNKEGEVTMTMERKYEGDNVVYFSEKGGKYDYTRWFSYDANGNRVKEWGRDNKNKLFLRKRSYDLKTNNILQSELYEKDTTAALKRLAYSYYEDGSKKSIAYFEKNKLVYTWTFDCKPEGVIVDMKKSDSTLICKKEETDENGNIVTWQHEFNSEGNPVKIKWVRTPDSKLLEKTTYRPDGSISSQMLYLKDGGHISFYTDKKGRINVDSEVVVNSEGKTVYSSFGGRREWMFYEGDMLVRSLTSGHRHTGEVTYSYTYHQ